MVPCRLRRLTEDDVPMILPWRNHPDVRRFMYTQHEISPHPDGMTLAGGHAHVVIAEEAA